MLSNSLFQQYFRQQPMDITEVPSPYLILRLLHIPPEPHGTFEMIWFPSQVFDEFNQAGNPPHKSAAFLDLTAAFWYRIAFQEKQAGIAEL